MKVGDMVYYIEQRMVEIEFIGIIIDGPHHRASGDTRYKVWWTNQRNWNGSATMGWWSDFRLRVINEG
jgi:hypothetical protein